MEKGRVILRYDYAVTRGARHNIQKGKNVLVFINGFRRDIAGNNGAEYAHVDV